MVWWRAAAGSALAGGLATLLAVQVQAAEICLYDPPLSIQLPSHDVVTVYVTEGAYGHQAALNAASITYTVHQLSKSKLSLVTVSDLVPDDSTGRFWTFMVVSSEPNGQGVLYGATSGTSGVAMSLMFAMSADIKE